jgi:Rod binding domain-containing protein
LYICLLPVWGAADGDHHFPITRGTKNGNKKTKNQSSGPKRKEGLSFKEIPTRNTSARAGKSGAQQSVLVATSEPAVEISAKGRDKPMVRHQHTVKPKIPLLGVSHTDIPLQGASTSSKPTVGEGQGHLVSQAGGPRLAKKALSGCARQKLKKAKARASEAGTGGIHQCKRAKAGRNLNQNHKEAKVRGKYPHRNGQSSKMDQELTRKL